MNRILFGGIAVAVAVAIGCSSLLAEEPPAIYTANFTTSPPVIDGRQTDDTEWLGAETAAAGWRLLNSNNNANDEPDTTNNGFEVVWDSDGIYLRHQVEYGAWPQAVFSPEWDAGLDSLLMYFDPNTDGETNDQTGLNDDGIDAYHIAFNQVLGITEYGPDVRDFPIKEEAHVNQLFDNNGKHQGFSGMRISQTTDDVEQTGYTEIYIPWEDFDASDPEVFDPTFEDVGLYHPFQPAEGEEWFFNMARIEASGGLPAWVAAPGSRFFPSRPHGVLQFRGGTTTHGDLNGDGVCDAKDIDLMAQAVRTGNLDAKFDVNADGLVDASDHGFLVEDLHNTYFGDANLDGEFNSGDLVTVFRAGEYEDGIDSNSGWATGDWNGDGEFGSGDIVVAFRAGGYEIGPRRATQAVPEPHASLLVCLAGLVLGSVYRQRR